MDPFNVKHNKALEAEVELLNAEVTRLRMMVNRCVEVQDKRQQQQPVSSPTSDPGKENAPPHTALVVHQQDALATAASAALLPHLGGDAVVRLPLPTDPMAVLPAIFSGMDGTARLFKVLVETYPWLLPPELRDAQEKHERRERERRKKHAKKARKTEKSKRRSPSTSSNASSSSSSAASASASSSAASEKPAKPKKGGAVKKTKKGKQRSPDSGPAAAPGATGTSPPTPPPSSQNQRQALPKPGEGSTNSPTAIQALLTPRSRSPQRSAITAAASGAVITPRDRPLSPRLQAMGVRASQSPASAGLNVGGYIPTKKPAAATPGARGGGNTFLNKLKKMGGASDDDDNDDHNRNARAPAGKAAPPRSLLEQTQGPENSPHRTAAAAARKAPNSDDDSYNSYDEGKAATGGGGDQLDF